ncbi:MAG: TIGR00730 family Rossman fold protein [Hyphomicrobiaceae bacterium]
MQKKNQNTIPVPSGPASGPKSRPRRNVCVFCGSGPGRNPAYVSAARHFGGALATAGLGLVYGGGSLGLMGEVARAVLAQQGYVTGIIPTFLSEKERMLRDVDELIVTADMHERKRLMFERSDAFVALPGGIGTLEELVEQMTWAQLGRHDKPVVIANVDNFWAPLKGLLDHMRAEAFIRPGLEVRFSIIDRIEDVTPSLERAFAAGIGETGDEELIEKL